MNRTYLQMFRWLFCFQLSVALVLSKLLASSSKLVPSKISSGQGNFNQLGDYQYQVQASVPIAKDWAKSSSGFGSELRLLRPDNTDFRLKRILILYR